MKTITRFTKKGIPYVVQRLGAHDRGLMLEHLLALDDGDRSLRFGVATDAEAIARYVDAIDFDRGTVLGARAPDGALAGLAHVALGDSMADLGLSVVPEHRERGVASALAAAALREAQRLRADELRVHCAATNAGMRRIAARLGMEFSTEGSEVVARRRLDRLPRAGAGLRVAALASGA
jgi:RimJ/RimL family protein N-acetyltransferase